MTVWTRTEILELIALYKKAYKAAIGGKSYSIAGRSLTYQDLPDIRRELDKLEDQLDKIDGNESAGSLKSIRCVTVR